MAYHGMPHGHGPISAFQVFPKFSGAQLATVLWCIARLNQVMACIVMEYIVMAYTLMAYIVMACIVMEYIVMAYTVMAYTVMAYIVMAYIVMAQPDTSPTRDAPHRSGG